MSGLAFIVLPLASGLAGIGIWYAWRMAKGSIELRDAERRRRIERQECKRLG